MFQSSSTIFLAAVLASNLIGASCLAIYLLPHIEVVLGGAQFIYLPAIRAASSSFGRASFYALHMVSRPMWHPSHALNLSLAAICGELGVRCCCTRCLEDSRSRLISQAWQPSIGMKLLCLKLRK